MFVLSFILSQNISISDVFCFIEFSKAFDSIDRNTLYTKLIPYGISDTILNVIVNMYTKIKSKLSVSNTFELTIERMQHECLSTTLFSIYINSLHDVMKSVNSMRVKIDNTNITVLKYDDLLFMASSAKGLQEGLLVLKQYCTSNKRTVIASKSKLMCFSKTMKKYMTALYYTNEQLECVKTFKYLGITFSQANKFKHAINVLCQQARKLTYAV